MSKERQDVDIEMLIDTVLAIQTREECFNFFSDLCTVNELKAMGRRIAVARMLREKHIYTDIVESTGASTATISRVNRSLLYGKDGYDILLKRVDEKKACK